MLAGNRCQLCCRGVLSSDRPCQVLHHCTQWKEVKRLFAAFAAAATGTFDPAADTYEGWRGAGLLTQGGQGGRAAPLAWRSHRIPTHFPLSLHAI